jgi:hypothetical protein
LKLKLAILGVGVFAILSAVLHVALSTRGAIPFIYSFHGIILAIVVALTTTVLGISLRKITWLQRRNAFVLSVIYIALTLALWLPSVPVGDHIGRAVENVIYDEPISGDGFGGWFYLDDSGMGAMPMTAECVGSVLIYLPGWFVVLIAFCWMQAIVIRKSLNSEA